MFRIALVFFCYLLLSLPTAYGQSTPSSTSELAVAQKTTGYRKQRRLERIMARKGLIMPDSEQSRILQIQRAIEIRNSGRVISVSGWTVTAIGGAGVIGSTALVASFCRTGDLECLVGILLGIMTYSPSLTVLAVGIGLVVAGNHQQKIGRSHLMRLELAPNTRRRDALQLSVRPILTPNRQGIQLALSF